VVQGRSAVTIGGALPQQLGAGSGRQGADALGRYDRHPVAGGALKRSGAVVSDGGSVRALIAIAA